MSMRRHLVLGAAACGMAMPAFTACSDGASEEIAARKLRLPISPATNDRGSLMRELVRYATLAPSSHNTQCWNFRVQADSIAIEPDLSRRCPVVDPDDHHLFVSLGCATENLVQAALANGLRGTRQFDPTGNGSITVALAPTPQRPSPLFDAIPLPS
jgi:hypothetical protein